MSRRSLTKLFFEHKGKLTDKWEHYLFIYETELTRIVELGMPIRLLEIGVQNGGSLELWAKYLPPGSSIVGIDIDPAVANLSFDGNVRAFVADVKDHQRLEWLIGHEPFDIIIDDGSHTSSDIISAFKILFPHLKHGGKYIAEDLHASYWPSHEGGLRLPSSSIEYFKNIIDALNADHFMADELCPADEKMELQALGKKIGRIAFYDSVAVVDKMTKDKEKPYRHLVSGLQTLVNDPSDFIVTAPTELIEPWLFGESAARSIDIALKSSLENSQRGLAMLRERLASQDAAVKAVADERNAQQSRAATLELLLAAAEQQLAETKIELAGARSSIEIIMKSRALRAARMLRRISNIGFRSR